MSLLDMANQSRLLKATNEARDRARLRCLGREGVGEWLSTLPSCALGLNLRPQEFTWSNFVWKWRCRGLRGSVQLTDAGRTRANTGPTA